MKDKPNEWVAISDLMAGVMAVVMLLLVISVVQNAFTNIKHTQEVLNLNKSNENKTAEIVKLSDINSNLKNELEEMVKLVKLTDVQKNKISEMKRLTGFNNEQQIRLSEMLKGLEQIFSEESTDGLVFFDIEKSKITLKDNIFSRSSACITPKAKKAVSIIEGTIQKFLNNFEDARIYVEGHTDNIPVSYPVIDFNKYCTVYDDNYTLSAARAREARKVMIGDISDTLSKRVVVAGYGDSNPIKGIDLSDAQNRRVEVRFVIDAKLNKNI